VNEATCRYCSTIIVIHTVMVLFLI